MESIGSADGQQQSCWIPKLIVLVDRIVGATVRQAHDKADRSPVHGQVYPLSHRLWRQFTPSRAGVPLARGTNGELPLRLGFPQRTLGNPSVNLVSESFEFRGQEAKNHLST